MNLIDKIEDYFSPMNACYWLNEERWCLFLYFYFTSISIISKCKRKKVRHNSVYIVLRMILGKNIG